MLFPGIKQHIKMKERQLARIRTMKFIFRFSFFCLLSVDVYLGMCESERNPCLGNGRNYP